MVRANLCVENITSRHIMLLASSILRKNFTQRKRIKNKIHKRKQTKVKKRQKQKQRQKMDYTLKESFTRCCYNMFNAFHPIDDRILMRVLSIVFNVCR